ncbi:MAG: RNA polymerase sigma factor [Caldilineaceae bacterium]
MNTNPAEPIAFASLVAAEQPRLVRLCSHLTGDSHAAEDLAQEALLIAWRRRQQLTEPAGVAHWLTAIARNVCRHHQRAQTRRQRHLLSVNLAAETSPIDLAPTTDFDLEVELERSELITLLDRALALLPDETRGLLIQHYVEELPQAELAARLGMTTGAVAVRLHRGKLALRQTLITDFREDAVTFGLVAPSQTGWSATRIWCPVCGQNRLLGQFDQTKGELELRCPGCNDPQNENERISYSQLPCLHGIKAYKPALKRMLAWVYDHYFKTSNAGSIPCLCCGRLQPLRIGSPPGITNNLPGVYIWCEQCNASVSNAWSGLALCLPQGRAFWQKHPRICALPEREVEIAGTPAILASLASVTDDATFEAAFSKNTFEVIYVQ